MRKKFTPAPESSWRLTKPLTHITFAGGTAHQLKAWQSRVAIFPPWSWEMKPLLSMDPVHHDTVRMPAGPIDDKLARAQISIYLLTDALLCDVADTPCRYCEAVSTKNQA